jgi:multidrug efflux pump subunit AcrB
VLGCTVTLLFAFLPLLFLPEGAGIFIRSLPAAVLYTVLASLFVAYTVIPFLASRVLRAEGETGEGGRALKAVTGAIRRWYVPALHRALARPRATMVAATAFVLGSLALVPLIGFSLFPSADIPQFRITVETPDGASLADTDRALRFVEDELARRDEVKHWFANLGRGNPRVYYNIFPEETSANVAEVFAELHGYDPQRSPRLYEELRAAFAEYPGARILLESYQNGPPINAPIEVAISGPDLEQLRALAAEAETLIEATPGTRDVDNPVRRLRTDLDLRRKLRCSESPPSRSIARCARRWRASAPASSASPTATSSRSRCGCPCRTARRSKFSTASRWRQPRGAPCRCGSLPRPSSPRPQASCAATTASARC